MMLLRDTLERFDATFVTTSDALVKRAQLSNVHIIPDCNRDTILVAARSLFQAIQIVFRERPDIVITTGALPGLFCLLAGRWAGARTVWLDSVANVEKLSSSGRAASKFASLCLTQWEHLAIGRVRFAGRLL
ncbi:hypothetical protein ASE78_17165 [Sphingomonas sp. Leaf25]|nr:hypothetical protein ASE78_17165 [Sphingomonas sp. Leaf25]